MDGLMGGWAAERLGEWGDEYKAYNAILSVPIIACPAATFCSSAKRKIAFRKASDIGPALISKKSLVSRSVYW